MVHDVKHDIVEVLNQMLKDSNNSISNNSNSCFSDNNKIGHLLITIKFFKFTYNKQGQDNDEELRVI